MKKFIDQFQIPNFHHYTLDNGTNHDEIVKKFFINNHSDIVEEYIDILPKPNNIINFDGLQTLYLLDKDLRTCIYTVLEEIETALKSFMKIYISKHNIDLLDKTIYIQRRFDDTKLKLNKTIKKIKQNNFSMLKLYFSDVSKIISCLQTNQQFIKDIHKYFMPYTTLTQFKTFVFILSLLRNEIAHHYSCIKFCMDQNDYNLKSMLENLYTILNCIRNAKNQSSWLERVEYHINDKLKDYESIKIRIGYE